MKGVTLSLIFLDIAASGEYELKYWALSYKCYVS